MHKKNGRSSKETLETEIDLLKITLNHYVKENEQLKQNTEDMKITVKANKQLLKEYVDNITGKDKVVEKLRNQVEQLESRLLVYEKFTKNLPSVSGNQQYKSIPRRDLTPRPGIHCQLSSTDNNHSEENTIEPSNPRTEVITMRTIELGVKNMPVRSIKRISENKFDQYYAQQSQILQELANLKKELSTFSMNERKICVNNDQENEEEKAQVKIKTINIKEHFEDETFCKFRDLLSSSNGQNIMFLIDGCNNVWELVKREDLNERWLINNPQSVEPIINSRHQELAVMDIKDNPSKSLSNSDLDLSKASEFNISNLIKDTENETGDIMNS